MRIGKRTRPAIFLDRDGVLNATVLNPRTGRMESPLTAHDLRLIDGVIPALQRLQRAGYPLILASNQPNYALGKSTWRTQWDIQYQLVRALTSAGIGFTRFTGRTAIWAQVAHFILLRPLCGYGYDAFWRGMQGPSFQIAAAVHFIVAHAHNGFLEIALELGAAGLLLFLLSWLRGWLALWPLWQHGSIDRIAWPLAILLLIALYDLDENTLLIYNGLFWILYVSTLVTIERAARSEPSESAQRASRMGDRHHTAAPELHEILNRSSSRAKRNRAESPALTKPAPELP